MTVTEDHEHGGEIVSLTLNCSVDPARARALTPDQILYVRWGREPNGPEYGHTMITRALVLAAVPVVLLVASASAAQPGSYSGTSVNKEIFLYGDVDPRTDKGKVTFKVRAHAAKEFKLKAQQFMCGATTAEIPVTVPKITLNATGQGKGTLHGPVHRRIRGQAQGPRQRQGVRHDHAEGPLPRQGDVHRQAAG